MPLACRIPVRILVSVVLVIASVPLIAQQQEADELAVTAIRAQLAQLRQLTAETRDLLAGELERHGRAQDTLALEGLDAQILMMAVQEGDVDERELAGLAAMSRLYAAGSDKTELTDLRIGYYRWRADKTEESFVSYASELARTARRQEVKSRVTFQTVPQPGATIKYLTRGGRARGERPTTAGAASTIDDLYIGFYYVWAERNGDPTTSRDQLYTITQAQRTITLAEDSGR